MALAVRNKIIDLLEVLPERVVHGRGAGKLHVSKIDFLFIQNFGGMCERNLRSGRGNILVSHQGAFRSLPQLQDSSDDNQKADGCGGQGTATEQVVEAKPPGGTLTLSGNNGCLDNSFEF